MTSRELIIDCQYGSTGKGLFAGYLAHSHRPDVIAYAPSPNAGHTLIWDGHTYIHKMLPSGITSPELRTIVLGPGSLIDLNRLQIEIEHWRSNVPAAAGVQIYLHEHAACVYDRHRAAEAGGNTAPGSTRQGVGAAQIERIKRNPEQTNMAKDADHPVFAYVSLINTPSAQQIFTSAERLQIESCQGYSLSVYHGQYPYTTSRDVTTASILADTGVPWSRSLKVYGTFRTYPIRVANRPEAGEWSGPTYMDSREITFADIGQKQELTTVTQLPRRIFTFSQSQAIEACVQNHVDYGFLNFAQYPPEYKDLVDIWEQLNESTCVQYLGFGPNISDIYRVSTPALAFQHIKEVYAHYH